MNRDDLANLCKATRKLIHEEHGIEGRVENTEHKTSDRNIEQMKPDISSKSIHTVERVTETMVEEADNFNNWFLNETTKAHSEDLDFIRNNDLGFSGSNDIKRLVDCLTCIGASDTTWDPFSRRLASGYMKKKSDSP